MTIKRKLSLFLVSIVMVVCAIVGITLFGNSKNASAAALSSEWYDDQEYHDRLTVGANDFSIIAMGDHQIAITNDTWMKYVESSYNYIANNSASMNLKMYINLGDVQDVVDFKFTADATVGADPTYNSNGDGATNGANRRSGDTTSNKNIYFWQQQEFNVKVRTILSDANVPNTWIMGNHDYEDMAQSYRIKKTFNQAFPLSMYDSVKITDKNSDGKITEDDFDSTDISAGRYFGGSLYDDVENSYYYFEGNGQKYMMLNLGIHPDYDIINWANQILAENPNCKVILSTHAYLGQKLKRVLYEKSERLWEEVISKNDNVFMVLCGHNTLVDGSISKRIDFNDFGHPVYQFMINSQDSPMGGLGVFSQIIFRENGDIDFSYYAPAVIDPLYKAELNPDNDKGMFFTRGSQFTINYSKTNALTYDKTGEVVVGNVVNGESMVDKFYLCSDSNSRWLQSIYSYNNIKVEKIKGISVADSTKVGYITYHFIKPNQTVFKDVAFNMTGEINKFTSGEDAVYELEYSFDGENFFLGTFDNTNLNGIDRERKLIRYINNCEDLYVRFVIKADANSHIETMGFDVSYVQTVYGENVFKYEFVSANLTEDVYDKTFLNDLDTAFQSKYVLGTGDKKDHVAGYGEFTYRFDAPNGSSFKTLKFNAQMRVGEALNDYVYATGRGVTAETRQSIDGINQAVDFASGTYSIKEADNYLMKLFVSVDNGVTFSLVTEIENPGKINYSFNIPEIDLSTYVDGISIVQIKIEFFGIHNAFIGFNTINIDGTYDIAPSPTFHLEGGTAYGTDQTVVSKDGYTFEGWHLESVSGQKVNPKDYEGQNVNLYAKWLKNVKISYVLNGGINNPENVSMATEGDSITLNNASKTGSTFLGWFMFNGIGYQKVTALNISTNHITLYAVWHD